jgi:hypothetical protein
MQKRKSPSNNSYKDLLYNEKARTLVLALLLAFFSVRLLLMYSNSGALSNNYIDLSTLKSPVNLIRPSHPIDSNSSLREVRLGSLSLNGTEINRYELSSLIFDQINYDCAWRPEFGYYKDGLALYNPHILIFPQLSPSERQLGSEIQVSNNNTNLANSKIDTLTSSDGGKKLELSVDLGSSFIHALSNKRLPSFRAVALNAADLGFQAIQLNPSKSREITYSDDTKVKKNAAMLVCFKESSLEPYNQIGLTNAISEIQINKLPAAATFNLWRQVPANLSTPTETPDVEYTIRFY